MSLNRREFSKLALGAACASALPAVGAVRPAQMKAVLLHLGRNMWCDWARPGEPTALKPGAGAPGTKLRLDEESASGEHAEKHEVERGEPRQREQNANGSQGFFHSRPPWAT